MSRYFVCCKGFLPIGRRLDACDIVLAHHTWQVSACTVLAAVSLRPPLEYSCCLKVANQILKISL